MAALRAGLPVIKSYNTTTGFEHTTYAIKPEHLNCRLGLNMQYKLVENVILNNPKPTFQDQAIL